MKRMYLVCFFTGTQIDRMLQRVMLFVQAYDIVFQLAPSICIFLFLFVPFFGLVPYLDGDVEFLIAANFYRGEYLSNWIPYHPPLKLFLSSIFFHLFIFNYNWVLWIIALYAIPKIKRSAAMAILVLFSLLYIIIILSFQTYSITRYMLPVLPLLYLLVAVQVTYTKYTYIFVPIVFVCVLLSLFTSTDPVSNRIWPVKWQLLDQSFYRNRAIDGDDGITYNMQFLYLTKERNSLIRTRACAPYVDTLSISPETLSLFGIAPCK